MLLGCVAGSVFLNITGSMWTVWSCQALASNSAVLYIRGRISSTYLSAVHLSISDAHAPSISCHRPSAYCSEQQNIVHKCSLMSLRFDCIPPERISSLPCAPPYSPGSTAVTSSHPATLTSIIMTTLSVPVEWQWQRWKRCQHESDRICGGFDHGMGSMDGEGSTLVRDRQRNRNHR